MTTQEKRPAPLAPIATVLTKCIEVAYHIGALVLLVCLVLFLLKPQLLTEWVTIAGDELAVQGFSMVIASPGGQVILPALVIFSLTGAITLELMAFVFRNVHLILRTAQGITKFSQGKTPFQKDNVRRMREIGIFFLSIVAVELAASSLAFLVLGPETAEVGVNMGSAITGILMLCLSQAFALGVQIQDDVDGLV